MSGQGPEEGGGSCVGEKTARFEDCPVWMLSRRFRLSFHGGGREGSLKTHPSHVSRELLKAAEGLRAGSPGPHSPGAALFSAPNGSQAARW